MMHELSSQSGLPGFGQRGYLNNEQKDGITSHLSTHTVRCLL